MLFFILLLCLLFLELGTTFESGASEIGEFWKSTFDFVLFFYTF